MTKEIWKDVPGFEGKYMVSSTGRVKSIDRFSPQHGGGKQFIKGFLLEPDIVGRGYRRVTLYYSKKSFKKFQVHRLVAIAFIPNTENKTSINHINGNKADNTIENLEWCTPAENVHHACMTGLRRKSKNLSNYEITEGQINKIHSLRNTGMAQWKIGLQFGVGQSRISEILSGKVKPYATT